MMQVQKDPRASAGIDARVGARLRQIRSIRGIRQEQVARWAGVSATQMQKYETGVNRIPGGRLQLIAERLDVPIAWFFEDGTDEGSKGADRALPSDVADRDVLEVARLIAAIPAGDRRRLALKVVRAILKGLADEVQAEIAEQHQSAKTTDIGFP